MTHTIRWSRIGWTVVSSLGGMVVATLVADSYADAILELAARAGGR